jgi:hypothetical protein
MTRPVYNFDDLKDAVFEFAAHRTEDEPLVLVLMTPGETAHRFVVAEHGIVKQDCDKAGRLVA